MFKGILPAALLMMIAPIVLAGQDGPNPGEDNPGATYTMIPFALGETGNGNDDCFVEANFVLKRSRARLCHRSAV